MIKTIKLNSDWECFFKGQKFEFMPITLLVGDQGAGKSTLLNIIKTIVKKPDTRDVELVVDDTKQNGLFCMDMENDNPRITQGNPFNQEEYKNSFLSKFQSHGEALLPVIKTIDSLSDTIILLDEPETALSLRSQFLMVECFKRALERNNQIIIATHNYVFMEAFSDSILSLENMKYTSFKKFLSTQKAPSNFKEIREDKLIKKNNCEKGVSCPCRIKSNGWFDNKCDSFINRDGVSNRKKKLRRTF